MERLVKFVEQRLEEAKKTGSLAETYCHQAFGAVMFYLDLHPEKYDKVDRYWDEARREFTKIVCDYYS